MATKKATTNAILSVLHESGKPIKKIRLMKLIFLLQQETESFGSGGFYEFLPYKYGPYSFAVDKDLHSLMGVGLVVGEELSIPDRRQSEAMGLCAKMPRSATAELREIIKKYRSLSDNQLIEDVYERYPEYTVMSERIKPRPQRKYAVPAVYSVGYEGKTIDSFLKGLIDNGIARIVDVRKNPISRKYGFSKTGLSNFCQRVGVEYVHIPQLGIPSDERQDLNSFNSYQVLLDRYEKEMLPLQQESIDLVKTLVQEKASALLCFEEDVRCCHRGRLAKVIASRTKLPIRHIGACNGHGRCG